MKPFFSLIFPAVKSNSLSHDITEGLKEPLHGLSNIFGTSIVELINLIVAFLKDFLPIPLVSHVLEVVNSVLDSPQAGIKTSQGKEIGKTMADASARLKLINK